MRGPALCLLLLAAACGGGGSGGSGGDPTPGPAYAETTSTGLAIGASFRGAAALAPLVVVAVSEVEMGADLNGDGDLLDEVVHRVDTVTGATTNVGAAAAGPILVSDRHFAFLMSEAGQGSSDLNGDGDIADAIWFVYDPGRPRILGVNPLNTMLAAPATGLAGAGTRGGFLLLQAEASANRDLNGDGDLLDEIPAAFDGAAFAVAPLALPEHATATPLVARNGRVAFAISEAAAALDRNGDGDTTDNVLGVVDFTAGVPAFLLAGGVGRAIANHPFALTGGGVVYFIDEATNGGVDLNNDGDAADAVLALFDVATGGGESLPMSPLVPSFALAGAPALGIGAGPDRVIVGVDEAAQGQRDINNDFDTSDVILGWVDTGAPATLHLLTGFTLGPLTPRIDGPRGLVAVSENSMTFLGLDLNGDGDTSDNVVFMLDTTAAPGAMNNLGFAVASFTLRGDDALVGVSEIADKGIDRNGDSMIDDVVQVYCDLGAQPMFMRSLAIVATSQTFFRLSPTELRLAALLPEGQSPNFDDLNGDGDTDDVGLELITIDPSGAPPVIVKPTPFFAGTESLGNTPPLRVGDDTFAFATSEAMARRDLNGDGDTSDTVLQYATIK